MEPQLTAEQFEAPLKDILRKGLIEIFPEHSSEQIEYLVDAAKSAMLSGSRASVVMKDFEKKLMSFAISFDNKTKKAKIELVMAFFQCAAAELQQHIDFERNKIAPLAPELIAANKKIYALTKRAYRWRKHLMLNINPDIKETVIYELSVISKEIAELQQEISRLHPYQK